ncbi:hypothetical protein J3R30DRAFT_306904 [Lentinula aciculospora]|uniref:Uncharacterized protein n=1 Tax=Lentinula aciculospora TaxID=153920 RepID=A0A9W9DLL4_9AGAR|nr:hypothetical protein J3R30DRAFT_306904 [Lentinula aciculospora]
MHALGSASGFLKGTKFRICSLRMHKGCLVVIILKDSINLYASRTIPLNLWQWYRYMLICRYGALSAFTLLISFLFLLRSRGRVRNFFCKPEHRIRVLKEREALFASSAEAYLRLIMETWLVLILEAPARCPKNRPNVCMTKFRGFRIYH